MLASVAGLSSYLAFRGVLLKEFKPFVTGVTETIRREVEAGAEVARMRVEYLNDSSVSKEERAIELAKRAGRTMGLRAILSAVEPCRTFFVRKNAKTGMLELQNRPGKCLHYYHYWLDDRLGPCHVRLRAHGVIQKVTSTHRYQVTPRGRELITGLTTTQAARPKDLQNHSVAA